MAHRPGPRPCSWPHSFALHHFCFALIALIVLVTAPARAQEAAELQRLLRTGNVEAVVSRAERALDRSPNDPDLHIAAAVALIQLGQHERATAHLEQVLRQDSAGGWSAAWAHVHRGVARFAMGDAAGARTDLEEAARLNATRNSTRSANNYLRLLGLDSTYAGWSRTESVHFRLLTPPDTPIRDPQAFLREKEAAYARLQEFFSARVPKKIDIILWSSREQAARAGFRQLGFERPEFTLLHMRPDQSPAHELVHVLAYYAVPAPRVRTRLINEGVAVNFDLNRRDRLAAARAATRAAGPLRLADLWEKADTVPENILYPIAAAWVERLIERGGRDSFLVLLRNQSLSSARRIYGAPLDTWIAEFEHDLSPQPTPSPR